MEGLGLFYTKAASIRPSSGTSSFCFFVLFVARLFYLVNLRSSRNGLKSSSASRATSYAVSASFGQRDELRSSFLCSALAANIQRVVFCIVSCGGEKRKNPRKHRRVSRSGLVLVLKRITAETEEVYPSSQ